MSPCVGGTTPGGPPGYYLLLLTRASNRNADMHAPRRDGSAQYRRCAPSQRPWESTSGSQDWAECLATDSAPKCVVVHGHRDARQCGTNPALQRQKSMVAELGNGLGKVRRQVRWAAQDVERTCRGIPKPFRGIGA